MDVVQGIGQIAEVITLADILRQRIVDRLRQHGQRFLRGADHHVIIQPCGEMIDGRDHIAGGFFTKLGRYHLIAVFIIGDLAHKEVGLTVPEHGRDILIVEEHKIQIAGIVTDTQLCHCAAARDTDRVHGSRDLAAHHAFLLGLYSGNIGGIRPILIGTRIAGNHIADRFDPELAEQSGALLPYAAQLCDRDII